MSNQAVRQIAVIGAGPAGLYAAQKLSAQGYGVAVFNRDIKPGGLVEYGIFLDKHKIKNGFRAQFRQILDHENISYFGNVTIGKNGKIRIEDLLRWGFSAVLVTCGAQGTKFINLPGETLKGVYHAKDLVYHYNQLPPFSGYHFEIGKKVMIVGGGNVMTDIAHYLLKYRDVEEIIVVIRRGPDEVKFDQKEMLPIISNLDLDDFKTEMKRVSPAMLAIGQDPEAAEHWILAGLEKACAKEHNGRILLRFMQSPKEILADSKGSVAGVKLEQNALQRIEETVIARGTAEFSQLDVDTVIFAIGDSVNDDLELPMRQDEIAKASHPRYMVEGITFEVGNPLTGDPLPGIFYAGWSRNPSTGLAGIARRDGVFAASAIAEFLSSTDKNSSISADDLCRHLDELQVNYVTNEKLKQLESKEQAQAEKLGIEEYKYSTDEEMLKALGLALKP
ncbi:MAG: FAD-dependent oxidoreductase [Anaerolineaceae bacterium]